MTVIAWDGTTLAADKQMTCQGLREKVTKLHRVMHKDYGECLIGIAGSYAHAQELIAWFASGEGVEGFPAHMRAWEDASILVIRRVAGTPRIEYYSRGPYPVIIESTFTADGSGRDFAIAAMHCGKTADEAVEIASLYESGCGMGVDELQFTPDRHDCLDEIQEVAVSG